MTIYRVIQAIGAYLAVATLIVAAADIAGGELGAGTANARPAPATTMELEWGDGAAPRVVPRSGVVASAWARPGGHQLEWGRGGPPRLVAAGDVR